MSSDAILSDIISQCTKFISNETLKKSVLDPLIIYFKERVAFFYIILLIIITMLIVINVLLIFIIFRYGSIIIKNIETISKSIV